MWCRVHTPCTDRSSISRLRGPAGPREMTGQLRGLNALLKEAFATTVVGVERTCPEGARPRRWDIFKAVARSKSAGAGTGGDAMNLRLRQLAPGPNRSNRPLPGVDESREPTTLLRPLRPQDPARRRQPTGPESDQISFSAWHTSVFAST
jgi:hypothetical protein